MNKFGLFQVRGLEGVATPGNFCRFWNKSWKKYFQHLNWYEIVIWIWTLLFLEIWQFNHKLSFLLSSKNILCLKDCHHNLTKYEMNKTSKIPISQLWKVKNFTCLNVGTHTSVLLWITCFLHCNWYPFCTLSFSSLNNLFFFIMIDNY